MRALAMDTSHGPHPGWSAEQAGPVWRKIAWPGPHAAPRSLTRSHLHGLNGVGQFDPVPWEMQAGVAPSPNWWQQILGAGIRVGERIAYSEFPGPAAYRQTGPYGTTEIRGPIGGAPTALGPAVLPPWLIYAGLGLVLVIAIGASRRGG